MPPLEPTRVAISRYVLDIGGDAGTLISFGDAAVSDDLGPALEEERRTPAATAEGLADSAEAVTGRVEDAIALFNAIVTGRVKLEDVEKRIEPMLAMLRRLDRDGRWEDALRLARVVSRLVALTRRWIALLRLLGVAQRAASKLHDLPALGWVQHELGTLHLAGGELREAGDRLRQAREIRASLEDTDGLAATEQSQGVLCTQLHVICPEPDVPSRRGTMRRRLVVVATALMLLLAGGVAGAIVKPDPSTETLTAHVRGIAGGTVTSLAGIQCPSLCVAHIVHGKTVSLTPSARLGFTFVGWHGDCQGAQACSVRLDRARAVTARFRRAAQSRILTVRAVGDGHVASTGPGIDCRPACSTSLKRDTRVQLVATAGGGATFAGWSGGRCTGTGRCAVTMRNDVTVTARFVPRPAEDTNQTLTINLGGDGSGIVTSDSHSAACRATCTRTFPKGTKLVLTAVPSEGSRFASWAGSGCSDTGTCTITLGDQAAEVTASFELAPVARFTLTTTVAAGSGSIDPNCPQGCEQAGGEDVRITATPAVGSHFVRFDGCSSSATEGSESPQSCSVTMSEDHTVSATFNANEG
jgi:Divergent InlB B-repeat domain